MKSLNTLWNWVIFSSENSEKLSATVKGSVWFGLALTVAQMAGVQGVEEAANSALALFVVLAQVVSAGYALWGSVRKVHRTVVGRNAVLNDPLLNK